MGTFIRCLTHPVYGVSLAAGCVAAVIFASPPAAQAGIGACGNIHVEAEAMCELVPPGLECEGQCTPLSVRAACSAQLAVECQASCTDLPSVECSGSCQAECTASCTDLEPGTFDCQGSCQAQCSGDCEARCGTTDDGGECMARCEGSCSASCDGHCDVELPKADCDAGCEASCEGSCEADANFDCQASCQSDSYANCEADVQGGCDIACEGQEGALFCDGQYVDHGDNLDMCISALRAAVDVEVTGSAMGESSCDNGACMATGSAEGKITSDCSVAGRPGAPFGGNSRAPASLLYGFVAVLLWRKKRCNF
ncbi:MAG: hypothetical protein OEZ06_26820 [Myxococcales bacterium]|nr:hypothetical protein [Myxococcales bacterium]